MAEKDYTDKELEILDSFLQYEFYYEIYQELTNKDSIYFGLFEPLEFCQLMLLTVQMVEENKTRPLSISRHLKKELTLLYGEKPLTDGSPLHHRNLTQRHFEKILERAGLKDAGFVLYSLRHSCATLFLSAGENPKIVAERLGHSSVKITLDTYSHVLPDMQQSATDKLETMLYRKFGTF